jgi:hypothetical protein
MFRRSLSLSAAVLALLCVTGPGAKTAVGATRVTVVRRATPQVRRVSPGVGRVVPGVGGVSPGVGRRFINRRFRRR